MAILNSILWCSQTFVPTFFSSSFHLRWNVSIWLETTKRYYKFIEKIVFPLTLWVQNKLRKGKKRKKKWIIQRKNENKVIPLCPHRPGRDCQPTHIVRVPDSHGQPIVLTNSFALDEKTFTNFKKFQWWWRGRQVSKPRGYLFKIFKL